MVELASGDQRLPWLWPWVGSSLGCWKGSTHNIARLNGVLALWSLIDTVFKATFGFSICPEFCSHTYSSKLLSFSKLECVGGPQRGEIC